jgi:hypothetical protein
MKREDEISSSSSPLNTASLHIKNFPPFEEEVIEEVKEEESRE